VTITVHRFFGPRLVALQVSDVTANAAEPGPDSEIVSAPVADPPLFISVNVSALVVEPAATGPKVPLDGLNPSVGGVPAWAADAQTLSQMSAPAAAAAKPHRRLPATARPLV
jgi:hypothetical protein